MAQMYGSIINRMCESVSGEPAPEIGTGATIYDWSDRRAATVIWISKSGKTIRIQLDRAIRTDANGMSESQSYRFERSDTAPIYEVRRGSRGWKIVGGSRVVVGKRDHYHDYSF